MEPVKGYLATKVKDGFPIDGDLSKAPWADLPWSDEFVDILGSKGPRPWRRTRMKMAYGDQGLYIAAEMEEPHLWATLTEHDSVIFYDNDFEVFLDPDGDQCLYAELEINALNTTWDLLLVKPYRAGGPAIDGFELAGLRSGVRLDGSLNDPSDTDKGWTLEIFIPWKSLSQIAGCSCPPQESDQWRVNFSRVQWHLDWSSGKYEKVKGKPEENWVWSPQGVVDMHRPHRWGYVQFGGSLRPLDDEAERGLLAQAWEAQLDYRGTHGHYALALSELPFDAKGLSMKSSEHQYRVFGSKLQIDQDARISRRAK